MNTDQKQVKIVVNGSGAREVSPREILRSDAGREQIRKTVDAVNGGLKKLVRKS